jgi:hypothetical protein
MTDAFPLELLSLIKELCRVDHYQDVIKHKKNLKWASEIFDASKGGNDFDLMKLFLVYTEKFSKTPPDIKAFRDFISTEQLSEGSLVTLDKISSLTDENSSQDIEYLVDAFVKHVRNIFHITNYQKAAANVEGKTVDFVKNWLHKRWTLDLPDEGPRAAGLLEDNTLAVYNYVAKNFKEDAEENTLETGFPSIDNNVILGFGQLSYVGIAGQSGHGKTMLLNTLVYNWLRAGKNILYNSLEHSPENIWTKITFLHSEYYREHFKLPPFNYWRMGKKAPIPISSEDWDHFRMIREDAEDRGGLKGHLDVQGFRTWDEINSHAKMNHGRLKYHAIVIDYLEHLDLPGDARFAEAEYKKLIKSAATMSRTFDNNRGIVVVTPLPINKAAAEGAGEFNHENPEQPFGLTGIRGLSQINYDMDLILGVHSDDAMKLDGEMVVFGLKAREGLQVPITLCKVNLSNFLVGERGSIVRKQQEQAAMGEVNAENVPKDLFNYADEL